MNDNTFTLNLIEHNSGDAAPFMQLKGSVPNKGDVLEISPETAYGVLGVIRVFAGGLTRSYPAEETEIKLLVKRV